MNSTDLSDRVVSMLWGVLAGLGAGFFWGFSFLAAKTLYGFSAGEVALGRFSAFGLLSLFLALSRPTLWRSWLTQSTAWTALLYSVIGYSAYYWILVYSVRESGIPVVSLIVGLLPLTIALASRVVPQRAWQFGTSLVLIAVGIGVLNWDVLEALFRGTELKSSWKGLVAAIVNLALWTWFAVANARFLQKHRGINNLGWTCLLGCFAWATSVVFFLIEPWVFPAAAAEANSVVHAGWAAYLFWTVLLGLGSTHLATWLWNRASSTLPTSLTGQLIVSETIFGLLFSFLYDRRLPTQSETVSMVLLIGGVLIGVLSFRSPHRSQTTRRTLHKR